MWVIPKINGGKPALAGLFQSAVEETALHVLLGQVDVAGTATVTVTVERAAGATEPNLPPVLRPRCDRDSSTACPSSRIEAHD